MKPVRARRTFTPESRQASAVALAVAALVLSTSVCAQTVTVMPRVSVSETLTNNVNLSSTDRKSEQITEVSPGVNVSVNSARLKTYFDYALNHVNYAQGTSDAKNQNALTTFGTFEAVDNRAFIDFAGSITQQALSPFGPLSNSNTAVNSNQAEYTAYSVSPYLRGELGRFASYDARYSYAVSGSDASANTVNNDATVNLRNASAFGNLGWTAAVSRQRVDFNEGRNTEADNVSLGLTYRVNPQLNLSANAGRESSNYHSLEKTNYNTGSVGLNWQPSERTTLSALTGRRSFGNTHSLSFEHRSARTVWRFTDSQDVTTSPNQAGLGSVGTAFDLFDAQFVGIESDPIARAQLVNNFLQSYGISPTASVVGEFLLAAASQQRRQDLSFALLGVRDTVTFLLTRTQTSRIDTITNAIDSLTNNDVVTQEGFSVNYSHRLTPDASLGMLLSRQNTSGSTSAQASTLTSVSVNLSTRFGRRTSGTVSVAHNKHDNQASPYTETALRGSLNMQF